MQVVNKLMMFSMAVSDMPKAKAFYADRLGLKVTTDYRQDDNNWWVGAIFWNAYSGQSRMKLSEGAVACRLHAGVDGLLDVEQGICQP